MFYYTECDSPIGRLTLASDGDAIVGLWINGQKYFLDTLPEAPVHCDELEIFYRAKDWLSRYFRGRSRKFENCR